MFFIAVFDYVLKVVNEYEFDFKENTRNARFIAADERDLELR